MVSKGNHPQMALIQMSEILYIYWLVYRDSPFLDYYKPNFFGGSIIPELIITFPHVSQSPRANHQPTEVLNTAHMGSTMFYLNNIGVTWSDTHLYLYDSRYLWAQPLMYWLQLSFFQGPWRLMVCPVGCCQLLSWRFYVRIYIYILLDIYIYIFIYSISWNSQSMKSSNNEEPLVLKYGWSFPHFLRWCSHILHRKMRGFPSQAYTSLKNWLHEKT